MKGDIEMDRILLFFERIFGGEMGLEERG